MILAAAASDTVGIHSGAHKGVIAVRENEVLIEDETPWKGGFIFRLQYGTATSPIGQDRGCRVPPNAVSARKCR